MQIKDIMTSEPACCTLDGALQEVAQLMVENDCGAIPVINNWMDRKPMGIITDRDIVVRCVAQGRNPLELTADACMTSPIITCKESDSVDDCCDAMEREQVRRMVIVNEDGAVAGIVAQADIVDNLSDEQIAEFLGEVSEPEPVHAETARV